MKEYTDIFAQDIEVPDVVLRKMDDALACIKTEDNKAMENIKKMKSKKRRNRLFRGQVAAVASVCILVFGCITTVAAIHHFWSRGMQGTIQATDEQQQVLSEKGIATVLTERAGFEELAVTVDEVTITPMTVITDDKFAHISFCVEGFVAGENIEPCFESTDAYLGDNPNAEDACVNMGSRFYNGIVTDENGKLIYDDGTPLEINEEGDFISHYSDENGNLEYVVSVSVADYADSLLGKTLHVNLKNIGTVYKTEYTNVMDGNWNFAIDLSDVSSATYCHVDKNIDDTVFMLDSVELSPISIKMNYFVNGEVNIYEDENDIPDFCGVVLKDGTKLPYLGNGGMSGYEDETRTRAYVLSAFDRVIEPNEVAAVLLRTKEGMDMLEVPIND